MKKYANWRARSLRRQAVWFEQHPYRMTGLVLFGLAIRIFNIQQRAKKRGRR